MSQSKMESRVEYAIFWSRWLQAPMYFGLIIAQALYVYKFGIELWHMTSHIITLKETEVLLMVLGLVDVVMIANLLLMVIVGGYETFVSRLHLDNHPDRPEWLGHVDAGMLKIKLAMSLITISSIHLLKTFIDSANIPNDKIYAQIAIHVAFLVSALALAYADKMMDGASSQKPDGN